ncbi:MAG: hypothetical protein QG632_87 [Candidatus Dependentiae bacterium]|nr:hypothetical protein [Candidatus Dependentiae bacterium]
MKNSFERLDNFIDRLLGDTGTLFLIRIGRYAISLVSIALLAICTAHFVVNGSAWSTGVIRADLNNIVDALSRFDANCGLQKVLPGIYSLEFLTLPYADVDKLAGFTVQKTYSSWQGPYLKTVPVVDGRPYVLLSTEHGLFVAPSYGVRLPNGTQLGANIVWDWQSDVEAMAADDGPLSHQGEPLVRKFVPTVDSMREKRSFLSEFMTALSVAACNPDVSASCHEA